MVVVEKEGFEVDETGEIGDRAGDGVAFEAQDAELIEIV